jgi:hypothetical protein
MNYVQTDNLLKYYISVHSPSSRFYLKHRLSFSKHNVLETGYCLRLQVKPTLLDPVDIDSMSRQRQNPVSETLCFKQNTVRWIMSRNIIFIVMYNHHKLLDLINSLLILTSQFAVHWENSETLGEHLPVCLWNGSKTRCLQLGIQFLFATDCQSKDVP